MTGSDAVKLIHELVSAEIDTVKQANFRSRGVTKKAAKREVQAASALFVALCGGLPSEREISEMIGG